MIVLHGANDTNVPVVEAEQVVENLKTRKRAGRVRPVPGRRARLAEGSEPHPIHCGDHRVLREASGGGTRGIAVGAR